MRAKKKYPREWNKGIIQGILQDLDAELAKKGEAISVTAIGGVAIVLQGFIDRSTNDLDLAPISDALRLLRACERLGIDAQIVTQSSTVDFNVIEKIPLFKGKALEFLGVKGEDLIRLKLERFQKHDPEDIYAIIQKEKFPYERFAELVDEGRVDYIGRVEEYLISAHLVVERMYPDKLEDFSRRFRMSGG